MIDPQDLPPEVRAKVLSLPNGPELLKQALSSAKRPLEPVVKRHLLLANLLLPGVVVMFLWMGMWVFGSPVWEAFLYAWKADGPAGSVGLGLVLLAALLVPGVPTVYFVRRYFRARWLAQRGLPAEGEVRYYFGIDRIPFGLLAYTFMHEGQPVKCGCWGQPGDGRFASTVTLAYDPARPRISLPVRYVFPGGYRPPAMKGKVTIKTTRWIKRNE